ncbi:P1 family peptidase [Lysinibacillus capsici]|uniref:P1 family peptidase n=1 Tax=Lysinibacillus capsici TaxID=2115968 RepID=UPI001C125AF1|nr:P1 family peptidase [Lysinibacillus capsici]MBU5251467.1 P1 family peptidase [Lysinibacillus capsici]
MQGKVRQLGIEIGMLPVGQKNCITDVEGVQVGHVTLDEPLDQNGAYACTGVTAILPHGGNVFQEKVTAASYVLNGFGKTTGLVQVNELGVLESPIMLTNTFGVPAVTQGTLSYMLDRNEDIGLTTGTINLVVGCLVLSNFGQGGEFLAKHYKVSTMQNQSTLSPTDGSIIIVLATDAPLSSRQLTRVIKRCGIGLGRTGSHFSHGSGDIVIGFTTAYCIPHTADQLIETRIQLREDHPIMNQLFTAAAEATEEAILNSLSQAQTTTGRNGHTVQAYSFHQA